MREGAGRYIRPIQPKELVDGDIKWLHIIAKMQYYGYTAEHIIADCITKDKQLWRMEGEGLSGLTITLLNRHPGGNELVIWAVAGFGFLKNLERVVEDFLAYMGQHKITWLSGVALTDKLAKAYEGLGCKRRGDVYIMDLPTTNKGD